jgi:hypothetical protein
MIPLHVHTTVPLRVGCEEAVERLTSELAALATEATALAIEHVAPLARGGGFRATALPSVTVLEAADDDVAAAVVRWEGDEEATGWPAMTLSIVVTPTSAGSSRLALLSPRHPGYDLSTNRIDKVWRDRLARAAVRAFATALAEAIAGAGVRGAPVAAAGWSPSS